ncbi:tRNA nucleotidyltransferase [Candidatus Microgenomates bacterium]|nr:MAG: tRNA nucleotidyltransferase [Candidatus Microgenomates bacterium]
MKSADVIKIYKLLTDNNIDVWLDGGWGVDALLGKQTREHGDVDIVVQEKDISRLRQLLGEKGYQEVKRDDTSAWNFVLGNGELLVDVHVVVFDEKGNGIYGPKERGVFYPAYSFKGTGKIEGLDVNCLTAEYQVESHTGYEIDKDDYNDVSALCEKFNIPLPKEYDKFKTQ